MDSCQMQLSGVPPPPTFVKKPLGDFAASPS